MFSKKPMTEAVRNKLKERIKNKLDCSDIFKEYNLKGERLVGAIFKEIKSVEEDLEGTNFSNCTFGYSSNKDVKVMFINCNLKNCNFKLAKFVGVCYLRYCDLRLCNFFGAFMPFVEYQHSDMRDTIFCEAVFKLGSKVSERARFSWETFEEFTKYLDMDMQKSKENENE